MNFNTKNSTFNFQEARVFLSVLEYGTTSAAAESLDISASMVNTYLSRFEKKYGKKLFIRSRRTGKFIPTDEASKISKNVQNVLQQIEILYAKEEQDSNTVTVTSTLSILEYYLCPYLNNLFDKDKNISLNINQNESLSFDYNPINEIVITCFTDNPDTYEYFPYHSFKQKLWASLDYINKYGDPTNLEKLLEHTLLLRKNVDEPRTLFGSEYIKTKLIKNKSIKAFEINSSRLIDYMCEKGWGIMSGAEETLKLGNVNVKNVFPNFKGDSIDLYVAVNKDFLDKSSAARTVVNWIFESRNICFDSANLTPSFSYTPI